MDDDKIPVGKEDITAEWLGQILSDHYKKKITVDEFTLEVGTKPGDNYLSLMLRATVTTREGEGEKNEHRLMIKCLHENKVLRDMAIEFSAYDKEIIFYTQILPDVMRWQNSMNQNFKVSVPECIYGKFSKESAILVMKDMGVDDYAMHPRTEGLTLEMLQLLLKRIGVYHGLMLAYEKVGGVNLMEKHRKLKDDFEYMLDAEAAKKGMPDFMASFRVAVINAKEIAKSLPFFNKIEYFFDCEIEHCGDRYFEIFHEQEPFMLLTHSDLWSNNLLFQKDPKGNVSDVCILDWQIVIACSPMVDLNYLIFSSTNQNVRKNMKALLQCWYDEFYATSKAFGLDVAQKYGYTFEFAEKEFRKFQKFGVAFSFFMVPIACNEGLEGAGTDGNFLKLMEKVGEQLDQGGATAIVNRLKGVIEDSYHAGIFD